MVPRRYRSVGTALAARARRARRLGPVLEEFLSTFDPAAHVARDPVRFVHAYADPADREVAGLVASSLAFGQVEVIGRSVAEVLGILGPHPARAVADVDPARLALELDGFVHRWIRGPDVAALLAVAGALLQRHGSIGAAFERAFEAEGHALRPAIGRFVHEGRRAAGGAAQRDETRRGLAYLLPDATGTGALKRLHLYLRWMVRGPDAVDVGLWRVPKSALLLPLDTHTGRICRYVGLTRRQALDWRTAEEVTWNLRAVDPDDPVKFDFALCHLGIAGDCLHRRDAIRCGRCDLAPACRL